MKTFEQFINEEKNKTIKDFPYVIEFFKNFYPDKNISNIPVYIISEEEWPYGKGRQTENDRKGGIRIHEQQVNKDEELGWLIHEVGHVLQLNGDKKPRLISKKEFPDYPNANDEQTPMWYQFHYLINKGLSEDNILELEERDYKNSKGSEGVGNWNDYKNRFFRRYYNVIKEKLKNKS
jgi:hypothetical protein